MKVINTLIPFFFFTTFVHGQETYYKMPDNQIFNKTDYDRLEKAIKESGLISKIVKSQERNDSIIKTIGLFDSESERYYDKFRNEIGYTFKIEKFKDKNGNYYPSDYLRGKPSLINFWFTTCSPCIEEIPNLNIISTRFNDSVHFIAITFEKEKKVADFLKTRPIHFEHIVNSQKQLNNMSIEYYPMTLLLDKEGKIVDVYPQINFSEQEIIHKLDKLK